MGRRTPEEQDGRAAQESDQQEGTNVRELTLGSFALQDMLDDDEIQLGGESAGILGAEPDSATSPEVAVMSIEARYESAVLNAEERLVALVAERSGDTVESLFRELVAQGVDATALRDAMLRARYLRRIDYDDGHLRESA